MGLRKIEIHLEHDDTPMTVTVTREGIDLAGDTHLYPPELKVVGEVMDVIKANKDAFFKRRVEHGAGGQAEAARGGATIDRDSFLRP